MRLELSKHQTNRSESLSYHTGDWVWFLARSHITQRTRLLLVWQTNSTEKWRPHETQMQEFSASSRWPLKCKLIVGLCWICRSSYSEFTEGHRWRSKDPVTLSTTVLVRKTTSLLLCEPSHTHRCIAWTTQTWLIQGFLVNSKHYSEYIRKKLELIYNIVSLTFFSLLHYHYYNLLPQFSRRNTSTFSSFSFSTLILCYDAKLNHRFPSLAHLKKGPAQEVSPHITVIQKENTHSHKAFSHTHTNAQLLCVERHVSAVFTGEKCFQFSNLEKKNW